MSQLRVQVQVKSSGVEPDLSRISNNHRLSIHYLPSYVVGERLGIHSLVLSRITGNIQVERGSKEK